MNTVPRHWRLLPAAIAASMLVACGGSDDKGVDRSAFRAAGMVYAAPQLTTDAAGNQTVSVAVLAKDGVKTLSTTAVSAVRSSTTNWWVYLPDFKDDIGSFGGGDIALSVGGNVSNLGVMSPTSGRSDIDTGSALTPLVDAQGNPLLEVRGGGNGNGSAGVDCSGGE